MDNDEAAFFTPEVEFVQSQRLEIERQPKSAARRLAAWVFSGLMMTATLHAVEVSPPSNASKLELRATTAGVVVGSLGAMPTTLVEPTPERDVIFVRPQIAGLRRLAARLAKMPQVDDSLDHLL